MDRRNLLLLTAIAIVAGVVALFLLRKEPRGPQPGSVAETQSRTPQPPGEPGADLEAVATPQQPKVDPFEPFISGVSVAPEQIVRVRPDKVLATVNLIPITLKDMVPLMPGDANSGQEMTTEDFGHRLNQAIEVELTFQAARASGVELTAEQEERLQQMDARTAADIEEAREQGMQWNSISPEQLEFRRRVTTAILLQNNLVERATGIPATQGEYADAFRQYMDQLKAAANIDLAPPAP